MFSGQYSYKRLISSPQLSLEGTARFEQSQASQIMYSEQGHYKLGEIEQTCYQKRIFVIDGSNLYIYKNDFSLLHEFILDNTSVFPLSLAHTYPCKNDRYFLEMMIYSFDNFSTLYRVQGPSKNHTIYTTFTRICAGIK